jgi:hypothetical protein
LGWGGRFGGGFGGGLKPYDGGVCVWIGLGWRGCDVYVVCGMVGGKVCAENMDGGGWNHGVE